MYARITVPTDGSSAALRALPPARGLASAFDCSVELVRVAPPGSADTTTPHPELDVPARVLEGEDVATALVADATGQEPPALLCASTHGRGGFGELVFGGVARTLLRRPAQSMVVVGPSVRPDPPGPLHRAVLCLDGSPPAESIVRLVREWAGRRHLEIRVLHVAPPLPGPREGDFSVSEETRAAADRVDVVVAALHEAGVRAQGTTVEGADVPGAIVDHAWWVRADLIAMATHGHSALRRALVGSVTDGVVRTSHVPVLLRRPEQLR